MIFRAVIKKFTKRKDQTLFVDFIKEIKSVEKKLRLSLIHIIWHALWNPEIWCLFGPLESIIFVAGIKTFLSIRKWWNALLLNEENLRPPPLILRNGFHRRRGKSLIFLCYWQRALLPKMREGCHFLCFHFPSAGKWQTAPLKNKTDGGNQQ